MIDSISERLTPALEAKPVPGDALVPGDGGVTALVADEGSSDRPFVAPDAGGAIRG